MLSKLWHSIDQFFPEQSIFERELRFWQTFLLIIVLSIAFSFLGNFLKADGFVGFDWVNFFSQRRVPEFYPPWTINVIKLFSWQLLIGVTLAAYCLATLKRSVHPASMVMAFLSLPLMWTLFLGQLEGLVVLGLIGLPWLMPFALIKPQVSIFAFFSRGKYIVALLLFLLLSIVLWGPWPLKVLSVENYYAEGRYPQNIGLGWWGLPLTFITVWFSRGDMDMLMASGSFMVSHIIPYNLLPLAPAISRLQPRAALIAFVFSWLPFTANWVGPRGWWLGWLFVIWIWINLFTTRYPKLAFSLHLRRILG